MYSIYGEVILELVDYSSIIPIIDDFSTSEARSELKKVVPIYQMSNTIMAFTKLVNWAAILFLLIVYSQMLLKYQTKDGFDKEFIKNNLKIVMGFSLLAPIGSIGFSLLQAAILAGVFISVMIANSVWLISMFFIEKMILVEQITPDVHNDEYKELVVSIKSEYFDSVTENAKAQLCDIRTIEKAINQTMNVDKTFENLQENEIYKCINEDLDNSIIETYNKNMPTNFIKSEYCLKKHNIIFSSGSYCGEFSASNYKDIDKVRELLKISNESHQNNIKQTALLMHEHMCKLYSESNKIGFNKEFLCVQQSIGYDYKYDPSTGEILSIMNTSQEQNENSTGISDIVNQIISSNVLLSNDESNYMSIVSSVILLISNNNGSIGEFLKGFLYDIKKGWLGSASIYFPKNDFILQEDDIVETLLSAMNFTYKGNSLYDGPYVNTLKTNDNITFTKEYIEQKRIEQLIIGLNKNFESNNNEESIVSRSENVIPKTFSVLSIINNGNVFSGGVSNCLEHLNKENCSIVSINPIKGLVKEGMNITEYAIPGKMITLFVQKIFSAKRIDSRGQTQHDGIGIANIASTGFSFLSAIGLFLTYALPLIPFFVFASVIIGWILNIFKTIIAAQFMVILALIPTNDENLEGHELSVYKLLINIFISPVFIVIGAVVCFILMHVVVAVTNVTFYTIVEFLNVNAHSNSISQAIDNIFALTIYVVIITLMIIKCSTAMYKIPEALRQWFNLEVDNEEQMFATLRNIVQKIVYMDIAFK